jgi:hypothetical protein
VALSLHLDRLVEESHEHLLALARVTLLSFTMVLFASMTMLVPPTGPHQTPSCSGRWSIAGLSFTFRLTRAADITTRRGFSRGLVRKRLTFPVIGYVLMLLTAVGIWLQVPRCST